TAFTNIEETMVLRNNNVPYKLESKLTELGVDFDSALVPFTPHVESDGLVVTGQNPASAGPTAKALIDLLINKK
ncbi:MAG: type 1 glutamine amidotransferase domain-containing protein, partial [Bacteroidota bacterium]